MQVPAVEVGQQLRHPHGRGDPGAVDRQLTVDEHLRHVHAEPAALAHECGPAPAPGVAQRGQLAPAVAGAVDGDLGAVAEQGVQLLVGAGDRVVDGTELQRQLPAGGGGVGADDERCAHLLGQEPDGRADGAQAGDEHSVASGHPRPAQRLVGGAEAARDDGAVQVGQGLRQHQEVALLGEQQVGVAAVPLPAVGGPCGCGAADLVPAAALVALAAAGDVVDDHAVSHPDAPDPVADRHHLTGGFVAPDHALVGLGALAQVLAVDRPQVRAADGGCLGGQQHLTRAGSRVGHLLQVDLAATGQERSQHEGPPRRREPVSPGPSGAKRLGSRDPRVCRAAGQGRCDLPATSVLTLLAGAFYRLSKTIRALCGCASSSRLTTPTPPSSSAPQEAT